MSSLFALLGVARDGLVAQTAGLDTTGQNVSNASTPGFVRRQVALETRQVGADGTVDVAGTTRSFDQFTYARVLDESSKRGAAQARSEALAQFQAIVAPETGGIGDKVNALTKAFNDLCAYPLDVPTRAAVIVAAEDVARSISGAAADLGNSKASLLTRAQGIAGEVNSRLASIAELNGKISEAHAQGDPASDLRDRRDVLVREIGDRIGAKTIEDASGSVTLFAAGSALVSGDQASSIAVGLDASGNMNVEVSRSGGGGVDVTANVDAGSLGGVREARDVDLAKLSKGLDELAFDLANAANAVHASGVGQDGVGGRPLFTPPSTAVGAAYSLSVSAEVQGHPERVAASASASDPGGNDVAVSLAQIANNAIGAGGTPSQRFGSLVADVGSSKASADSELALRQGTVAQVQAMHDSASGVSLDEEMVNMTRFQRAFEASAKVLKAADDLLAGLMQAL